MKSNKHILFFLIFLFAHCEIAAQFGVNIDSSKISRIENNISIQLELSMNKELSLKRNEMLMMAPRLVNKRDTSFFIDLPVMVVAGPTRKLMLDRATKLGNDLPFKGTPYSITKINDHNPTLNYKQTLQYEEWMKNATLELLLEKRGCAYCKREREVVSIASIEPYQPRYKTTHIQPEVEPMKKRADRYVATVNFRVDKDEIDRMYMNNTEVLDEADRIINGLFQNKDLKVSDIEIIGYASPEASVAYNKELSHRRAWAFANYIATKHSVPKNRMKVSGYGEDWEKIVSLIDLSEMPDKDAILEIIESVNNPDARDKELKKLSDGTTYRMLLNDLYPNVRRTEYEVSYEVRAYSVEEAREVFKENPKLLSLNEMYMVANSYSLDSEEAKNIFEVASLLFPNEPISIVNVSATLIEKGEYHNAINRLLEIENNSLAWNNLGVAYAYLGNYITAKKYFEKAVTAGDDNASDNMSELIKSSDLYEYQY